MHHPEPNSEPTPIYDSVVRDLGWSPIENETGPREKAFYERQAKLREQPPVGELMNRIANAPKKNIDNQKKEG